MREKIEDCIKDLKGKGFHYDHNLISGGYLSSFDIFELIIRLEEAFGIKIALEKIVPENLDSIDDIERLIMETGG